MLASIQDKVSQAEPLGNSIKFDFGAEKLFIDGMNGSNQASTEDKEADCVVQVSYEDFLSLIKGQLNPMGAVMQGKVKISGSMGVAMKLNSLFG